MSTAHILWTDKPVLIDPDVPAHGDGQSVWMQGVYPIGNGRLGCCPFGEPPRERIQFNQDSLWVGNEDNTGAYQPFGDVFIDLPHTQWSHYRRQLDLDQAVQSIRYESNGVSYSREYFASRPAEAIVMRFTADRAGALSGSITLGNLHGVPTVIEGETLVLRGNTSKFDFWQLVCSDPKRLMANREYASDKNIDLDFEARVCVLNSGGSLRADGDAIRFEGCDTLVLLLAADTNYLADRSRGWRREHPHDRLVKRIESARRQPYSQLLKEHVADYQQFFNRVSLDLGSSAIDRTALPTANRLKLYAQQANAGQTPDDRELESLLYQYARYMLIASSAPGPGTLPANLQGIWNINRRPSWRCDFHTDVNIQMNYWFADASNLSECFEPLAHWIDSIREVRTEETRRVFGAKRGWLTRAENGVFGGSTWHVQKGDSAWLCQNLWDHFTFTQDRKYLQRYAYPVMKEICEFWLDHLQELADGTLVAPKGRSPEHGPVDVDGVTYDQVLCWDLFNNTIEASELLGVDESFREELVDKRDRLLKPQIGKWGQLQEWMEDIDDPADDHRHVNHLICVYPGRQVHPIITPELAAAAKVGLIARRDHGDQHPSWSRVWKAAMFARLLDGESAYRELVKMLSTHVYGNLWSVHPPFQIDANFGFAAAVNEMLAQSHLHADDGTVLVHLLPALPQHWATGSVTGLRVRGALFIDMQWTAGELVRAVIRNPSGAISECTIRYQQTNRKIAIGKGGEFVFTPDT